MQHINIERQQSIDRLQLQVAANTIKQTESYSRQRRVNKVSQSAPIRFDKKLTGVNQQSWQLRRWQTEIKDSDSERSISNCPTYSSLSRHSPETRECATQITTLTPIESIEDSQEIEVDSPLPIDQSQIYLVEEDSGDDTDNMPISSGFGYYPYNYPTTKRVMMEPQISARSRQFRDKSQPGFNGNSKARTNGKALPPRPTAVKQSSPRSDSHVSPMKRNDVNSRVPMDNPPSNGFRRAPPRERNFKNSPPPPDNRRNQPMNRNDNVGPTQRNRNSVNDRQPENARRPLRLSNRPNPNVRSITPEYYHKPNPAPRDVNQRSRRMRVSNDDYVIERRRRTPDYDYDEYYSETQSETRRPRQYIRVVRDPPYRDDDDMYYVEPTPARRPVVNRRPPQREYVVVDEDDDDESAAARRRRSRRARRPEVVLVDDDRPPRQEDDYIYVDENGREVEVVRDRRPSRRYVEYIDDDDDNYDKYERSSRRPEVVYVDDDHPGDQRRNPSKSKHPSSTRVVYD